MSILIDELPSQVLIEGELWDINTSYINSILFELLMQDDSISDMEKLEGGLDLYYPNIPSNIQLAVKEMLNFYRCGKAIEEEVGNSKPNHSTRQVYSYEYDDDYIYSAFLDQYGIDLQVHYDLHWWKFKAMFKSLKEDNKISKIMSYRSIVINNDMSDSDKKFYKEMKQIYALPDLRTQEEKEKDFNDALSSMF